MLMNLKPAQWSFLVTILAVAWSNPASAQNAAPADGRIVGRVIDQSTGNGLSAVTVQIVGTRLGAISGIDGRYVINNVPSGEVTLQAASLGFGVKTITGVEVGAGAVEQNITLETAAIEIGGIEVTAAAERGSVNRALDQQRTASGIVNAVTAEQITNSPDSDAAQATSSRPG